ncbi:HAD family hydrolase [Chloroflexota bacterium]
MLEINIPGEGKLEIKHLVCDVNGTLATDGILIDGICEKINKLRDKLEIHILTADTHGMQTQIDEILKIQSVIISPGNESDQKADYIRSLGVESVAAIGQGANDARMLKEAKLGICILSPEGTAVETLLAADLVAPDIFKGLEILDKPIRIIADLRK